MTVDSPSGGRPRHQLVRLLVGSLTVLAGAACGSYGDAGGDVDWENYAPSVRSRIDSLAAADDCDGLQHEFDTADANDDIQRDRVGDGNADLMGYIDEAMAEAGCYG